MLIKIRQLIDTLGAELKEDKGLYIVTILLAERKVFFSRKKLSYIAKFSIDDAKKELRFTEMLKETGSGLSMGDVDELSHGFGFKKWAYNIGLNGRSGSLEEQSNLFGKSYNYKFDLSSVRDAFKRIAVSAGHKFTYQIMPLRA